MGAEFEGRSARVPINHLKCTSNPALVSEGAKACTENHIDGSPASASRHTFAFEILAKLRR